MPLTLRKQVAFAKQEYLSRLERIRARMEAAELDVLLATMPENICYITGFHTPAYYFPQIAVVTADHPPFLVLRALEARGAQAYSWLDDAHIVAFADDQDAIAVLADLLRQLGLSGRSVGYDPDSWFFSVRNHQKMLASLPEARFVAAERLVEAERAIKSPAEIACIEGACAMSERGIEAAVEACRRSPLTEAALAAEVHRELTALGSEYPGLPLFLSSGHRTLIPHATWSTKPIDDDDNILIELTGVVCRYAGPLFRTILMRPPAPIVLDHARMTVEMLNAVIDAIRPGVTSQSVNDAAVKAAQKLGGGIIKRAGYSVGLNFPPDWGEGSFLDLRQGNDTVLEAGMVFHVPQTMRMPGEVPIAMSETVLVTPTGNRVLTHLPRELIVVNR